ncbi:MAG: phospho-N-acetylmuramoyl-pentapeptide-transferase [Rickettsiaceae bacterium H1]|nr:phospho-N-acetylmuramoyl-pentapeptide-transferase [Rickettsiaceae bacterium H1]
MESLFTFLFSFFLSILFAPQVIFLLKKMQKEGQPIRKNGPQSHILSKKGTPTMGGIIILFAAFITTFIFVKVDNNLLIMLFVILGYGLLGGLDDYKKLVGKTSKGITAKTKLLLQIIIAVIIVYFLSYSVSTEVKFPFGYFFDFGWCYYPLAVAAIVSYSNAVNVTDGLDGLATVPIIIAAGCLAAISVDSVVNVVCIALIGSCLGFLFFNANPAKIFMGDIGSLSIGALLGLMSIITKNEVIFIIIAGLFVIEALSVIIQICYFKLTGGKRVFRMAPIHHHFEQLGWPENTVVVRFWIFSILCAAVGLSLI